MSQFLKDFNKAGLIEKLDGDDERLIKIEKAADAIAKDLSSNPPLLIRAILAGLDPEVTANDPLIIKAEEALLAEWSSIRSIHTDTPILLYRAILLDACDQESDGVNAVILWNTAADTLPLMRLGREENVINDVLSQWARKAEEYALVMPTATLSTRAPA
ncbi:MAG: hypothetical protein JKY54_10505, partial [Flavobacteriales bacterium]|nr:hypothetical protein [Flavobacteriales bacterium]